MKLIGARGAVPAPAGSLSIDGHNLSVSLFLNPARLGPKTALEGRGLDLTKYSPERVVGGNPTLEGKKPTKPIELRLTKLFEGHKIVGTTDGSADRKKQNLLDWVKGVARASGTLNLGKTVY